MTAMAVLLLSGELVAPEPADIASTFLGALTPKTTQATTFTWTGESLGTPSADRYIVVTINYRPLNWDEVVSAVTVGGVSATVVASQVYPGQSGAAIAVANVPTLTSPKNVSGKPVAAATISSSRRPSSAATVAPDVRTGVKFTPSPAIKVEPATGGGFVSAPVPPLANVVPSLALAAAIPLLPPGVVS